MTSENGTIVDVLNGFIAAAQTWGVSVVVLMGLAGLVMAIHGGKVLYDSAQYGSLGQSNNGSVLGGILMVVFGALATVIALVVMLVSGAFAPEAFTSVK